MTSIDAMHIADIMRAISARGALDLAKRAKNTISQVLDMQWPMIHVRLIA